MRFLAVVLLKPHGVFFKDDFRDQRPREVCVLIEHELLHLPRVNPEAARDQQQQTAAKQQATLPFEAGFTQQSFDAAIGHAREPLRSERRNPVLGKDQKQGAGS